MEYGWPIVEPPRRTHLHTKLLLIVVAALLPLVVMEAGMRLYNWHVKIRSPYRHAENPSVVFVRKPNADREINSLGFRDREHAIQKPVGTYRIVVLGDSVTEGYRVEFEDLYTRRLESLLNEHGGRFEVVSFGMNQYSTVQEVALLKETGLPMRPDLVILAYVLNDPTPDGLINDFFIRDRSPSVALHWIVRKTKDLLRVQNRDDKLPGCGYRDYYSSMHCDSAKWGAVTAAFAELGELSRRHGFHVLVVVFPLVEKRADASYDNYRWRIIHDRVVQEAARNGFSSLDLLPHFAKWKPKELQASPDDMLHPNGFANQIAATAIYQKVVGR